MRIDPKYGARGAEIAGGVSARGNCGRASLISRHTLCRLLSLFSVDGGADSALAFIFESCDQSKRSLYGVRPHPHPKEAPRRGFPYPYTTPLAVSARRKRNKKGEASVLLAKREIPEGTLPEASPDTTSVAELTAVFNGRA